jgi:primosomal protein N' (replication factor Y)
MPAAYCNVALPVPLRTTFTYAVPEALRGQVMPGSRVLAPFRKKSLVGVVVEMVEAPPEGAKIREISNVLDLLPALTPKLIELGHWIAGYYLAPIGEVFRAMLPPVTDLSLRRETVLTETGWTLIADLGVGKALTDLSTQQVDFLRKLSEKKGHALLGSSTKLGIAPEDLQRLQRRGFLEIRESMQGRKRKTQRIVAWKGPQGSSAQLGEKEERMRLLLTTERAAVAWQVACELRLDPLAYVARCLAGQLGGSD